ncbi:cellulose binding domain-containing protein [Actinacidiphila bryophytorum]|uniref:Fibronectin type III domain-containing protein n=1 Tax=Actinacidiphila bryophytorum TaxID=1436133 RepID=A0A9W4H362_9ACTN|nr:cellulose binding domain-containing protein [Actinacidiphila bryophytorum]MBN6542454.1 cellulose binding domain-containing protein [Actinacidiphila bryophytorum]CAG7646924.1 Fibronectin type III domain-containing protein [Actinacidiphila bryophytorum]
MRPGTSFSSAPLRRRLAACASAVALGAALLAGGGTALADDPGDPAGSAVDVTVNAAEGQGTIPGTAYGLNSAVWDSQMNVPEVQNLLSAANIGMMRYPGGSYGDIYHWQDNTAPGGYVAPGTDFDAFMGTVKKIGAQPILIANYGSGTPQEAADWVRYANITQHYGAKYWEVGNELYGNGHYGSGWETDNHADKSPTAYGTNVVDYATAMKAVDPSVKIGAVLTLPGNWPDGVMGSGETADWNHTVIPLIAGKADFVIVHWYPGGSDAAGMLNTPSQLAGELAQLHDQLNEAGVGDMPIALTELNSNVFEDTQPNALFGADAYLTALQNGVFTVDWWDTHNGPGAISTAPDGATDYNDYGILSSGTCVGTVCEPPLNTPFAPYHAISMLSHLGKPGDQMVDAQSGSQLVSAHAVHRANGDLSVMLINKDPANSQTVALHYAGFTADGSTATVDTFRDQASSIDSTTAADTGSWTVPPYSITTVTVHPKSGTSSALSAPGAPKVTAAGATSATVSWSPSTGGKVDRYEVYRQIDGRSELLATSTGTSATVPNLTPGSTFTWNVLARDSLGRLSRPSDPVTVRTGTPQDAPCKVSYDLTAGWGNGFNANVTVTNTSPNPITGWTLAFSFPSSGESVSGYWNANLSTQGTHVVATPVDWNGNLAANGGNSATFGFTGANSGAYMPPTVFTLNGAVCTTL